MEKRNSFVDIVLDEFKTDDSVTLEEGLFTTSPFLAYASFKKKAFNSFKNNGLFQIVRKIKKELIKTKAGAEIVKEKVKAKLGGSSGGTVYKFTKEQLAVLAEIYDKYGKKLVKEILSFRKSVIAPYQLIKRKVKKHGRISSKDVTGLSKEEYLAALESGRKKILSRGETHFKTSDEIRNKLDDYNRQLENINKIRADFSKDPPKVDYNIVGKLYKQFDIGGEKIEGYDREELRKIYDEIMKNYSSLAKATPEDYEKSKETIERSKKLWVGKTVDLTKSSESEFYKAGNFNTALGKYFFSREILGSLTKPGTINVFKKTYLSILDEMKKKTLEDKNDAFKKLVGHKTSSEFSEKEKKIWAKRPTVKHFSGNIDDYYQKVRETDFLEKPIIMQRPEEMKQAEQRIEDEIRKFERKLKQIMEPEDYAKLKKYRLIHNLITVKEMKDPKNLFKSKDELGSSSEEETAVDKGYVSPEEYFNRLKELSTTDFNSLGELNRAKKEIEDLRKKIIKQGDDAEAKKHEELFKEIINRTSIEGKKIADEGPEVKESEIGSIKDFANGILSRDYESETQAEEDRAKLRKLIDKFKDEAKDKDVAEERIRDLSFLLDKVEKKLKSLGK